ncbi:uncharacterized protein A4U43_C03F28330 [Asparagus officinalis]|uniref:Uncharacterized protein n=1 Tax=Asparagus officinalis TaxID=4686 RepID=A0A5P1FFH3_ASPOF|nr:uncharacterized protein A4U43_C03F28330 [Asparagus officinalis]
MSSTTPSSSRNEDSSRGSPLFLLLQAVKDLGETGEHERVEEERVEEEEEDGVRPERTSRLLKEREPRPELLSERENHLATAISRLIRERADRGGDGALPGLVEYPFPDVGEEKWEKMRKYLIGLTEVGARHEQEPNPEYHFEPEHHLDVQGTLQGFSRNYSKAVK